MLGDTIFATASAPGSSVRAVLRLSGPQAFAAAEAALHRSLPRARCSCDGQVTVAGFGAEAFALCMPGPQSYTGEDCIELHLPGSPALVAEVCAQMTAAIGIGLRSALPGEFTARACQNGRMDLAQAEGVLMLVHGASVREAARGAAWLAGGLSAAVARVRGLAQDALALVEAGLDFEAGETGEVEEAAWRSPLEAALREADALVAELPQAVAGGEALLLGASNAGKSSLCNALAGRAATLVDASRGTTRDVVRVELPSGGALWDAPGDLRDAGEVDQAALRLRDRVGGRAACAIVVVDPAADPMPLATSLPCLAVVWTKRDLALEVRDAVREGLRRAAPFAASAPEFFVSSATGEGIAELSAFLQRHVRAGTADAGEPVRHSLVAAADGLRRAAAASEPELVSQDVQEALRRLQEVDGAHGVDDLLDRIYGRFCLGK